MTAWLIIISVGLATYAMRLSGILLLEHIELPPAVHRALRFVPITVLPAIVAQELVLHDGTRNLALHNPRLLAGIVAAAVVWRTRNVVLTIVVGMLALLLFQRLW